MKQALLSLLILVSLFTIGCSNQQEVNNEEILNPFEKTVIDDECVEEYENSKNICTADKLNELSITQLEKCDWMEIDKEDFFKGCKSDINYFFLRNPFFQDDDVRYADTIYSRRLETICSDIKIGDLTFSEFDYCLKNHGSIELCESEY